MSPRRRRGLLLISVALASGGLAASQVHERERRAAERSGPSVDVLVATRDLPAGKRVTRDAVGRKLVPARFVPPDALQSAEAVLGARTSAPVARGGYLTAAVFAGEAARQGSALRRGERAVDRGRGGRRRPRGGRAGRPHGRARLHRDRSRRGPDDHGAGRRGAAAGGGRRAERRSAAGPTVLATLRVSLHQAIYLTAADNFARRDSPAAPPGGGPLARRSGGVQRPALVRARLAARLRRDSSCPRGRARSSCGGSRAPRPSRV